MMEYQYISMWRGGNDANVMRKFNSKVSISREYDEAVVLHIKKLQKNSTKLYN